MTTLLGFASGLPLALSSGTLQAWLTVEGVDLRILGWLSLVGIPYTYKFLWAPLVDRYTLPLNFSGRRRGWLIFFLILMGIVLFTMSTLSPSDDGAIIKIAILAIFLAFFSSSFDVVFDAWRAESLTKPILGLGAAWSIIGYRIAMMASGALALMLADFYIGFNGVYKLMALLCIILSFFAFFSPEPTKVTPPSSLLIAIVQPFKEFFSRPSAIIILLTIVFYKFGDAFTASLSTAFLLRGANFTPAEVGAVSKGAGLAATLIGGLFGGLILSRYKLLTCLLFFGLLQAITNLGFWWLSTIQPNLSQMAVVIVAENLSGGMGTAAFVALLMVLCDKRFTATQFALLSALASIGRVFIGPIAGQVAFDYGWETFFLLSFFVAIPGILMLFFLVSPLKKLDS